MYVGIYTFTAFLEGAAQAALFFLQNSLYFIILYFFASCTTHILHKECAAVWLSSPRLLKIYVLILCRVVWRRCVNVSEVLTAFIFRKKNRKDGGINISSVLFRMVVAYSDDLEKDSASSSELVLPIHQSTLLKSP